MKLTNYSELKNIKIVISFNQSAGYSGEIQPMTIEALAEAWTPEDAVRNISSKLDIGEIANQKISNEEIYKYTVGISEIVAEVLKNILNEGISEDVTSVDVASVKSIGLTDIKNERI